MRLDSLLTAKLSQLKQENNVAKWFCFRPFPLLDTPKRSKSGSERELSKLTATINRGYVNACSEWIQSLCL